MTAGSGYSSWFFCSLIHESSSDCYHSKGLLGASGLWYAFKRIAMFVEPERTSNNLSKGVCYKWDTEAGDYLVVTYRWSRLHAR